MALNPLFLNQCFDKNRLKNLITWSLLTVGERQTIETVENLKALGFQFATQAGVSLSVDDLKIPPEKVSLVSQASQQVEATQQAYQRGNLTAIEKLQQLVDTWHRTSETLKQTVVNHFQSTDKLSPVYMMAFSGARGNISQVRQLAGMRGLMADPQGQIIGFPIRSNFREGLTLTEYMISCYGARKGLVDTALRTADAGYLTRRLVDVSQHMIVKAATCATPNGIPLKDLQSSSKVVLPLRERLIGRVLAEDVAAGNEWHSVGKGSRRPSISRTNGDKTLDVSAGGLIACRNQEISGKLASRIASCRDSVVVRSPLTCSIRHGVCQLCYGWSLSEGRLVTLGEAVGIIAAQSIGEPGTQLTMRTFHTGGVFSGDVMAEVRAPHDGVVDFPRPLQGLLIRTSHGKVAFLTKAAGSLLLGSDRNQAINNEGTIFSLEPLTVLFVRQHERVTRTQLIAEFSSMGAEMNETIEAKRILFSEMVGQVSFANVSLGTRFKESGDILQVSRNLGFVCILSGRRSPVAPLLGIYGQGSHLVSQQSLVARVANKEASPEIGMTLDGLHRFARQQGGQSPPSDPTTARITPDLNSPQSPFMVRISGQDQLAVPKSTRPSVLAGSGASRMVQHGRVDESWVTMGGCSSWVFPTGLRFVPNLGYCASSGLGRSENLPPPLHFVGRDVQLARPSTRAEHQPKPGKELQDRQLDGLQGAVQVQPRLTANCRITPSTVSSSDCLLFGAFPVASTSQSPLARHLSAAALRTKPSLAPCNTDSESSPRGLNANTYPAVSKRPTRTRPVSMAELWPFGHTGFATRRTHGLGVFSSIPPLQRRRGHNDTVARIEDFYWLPGEQKSGQSGLVWVDSRYTTKKFVHGEIVWIDEHNVKCHGIDASHVLLGQVFPLKGATFLGSEGLYLRSNPIVLQGQQASQAARRGTLLRNLPLGSKAVPLGRNAGVVKTKVTPQGRGDGSTIETKVASRASLRDASDARAKMSSVHCSQLNDTSPVAGTDGNLFDNAIRSQPFGFVSSRPRLKSVASFRKEELVDIQEQHFVGISNQAEDGSNKTNTVTPELNVGHQGTRVVNKSFSNLHVSFARQRANPLARNTAFGNQPIPRFEGELELKARPFYEEDKKAGSPLANTFGTIVAANRTPFPQQEGQLGTRGAFNASASTQVLQEQALQAPQKFDVLASQPWVKAVSLDEFGLVLDRLVTGPNCQQWKTQTGEEGPHQLHLQLQPGWVYCPHKQANLSSLHESIQFCGESGIDDLFFEPALVYLEAVKGGQFSYLTADSLLIASLRVQLFELCLGWKPLEEGHAETHINPPTAKRGSLLQHLATQRTATQGEGERGDAIAYVTEWSSHLAVSQSHRASAQHYKRCAKSKPTICQLGQEILVLLRKMLWLAQASTPALFEVRVGRYALHILLQKRADWRLDEGGGLALLAMQDPAASRRADVARQGQANVPADLYQILFLKNLLNREPFLWLRAFPVQVQVVTNQKARYLHMAPRLRNRVWQTTSGYTENLSGPSAGKDIQLVKVPERQLGGGKRQPHIRSTSEICQAKADMEKKLLPLVQAEFLFPYGFIFGLATSNLNVLSHFTTFPEPTVIGTAYIDKEAPGTWQNTRRIVSSVRSTTPDWNSLQPTGWLEGEALSKKGVGAVGIPGKEGVLATSLRTAKSLAYESPLSTSWMFEPSLANPSLLVLIRKGHGYPLSILERSKATFLRRHTAPKISINKRLPMPLVIANSLAFSTKQGSSPLAVGSPDMRCNLLPLVAFGGFQTAFFPRSLYWIRFAGSLSPPTHQNHNSLQPVSSTSEGAIVSGYTRRPISGKHYLATNRLQHSASPTGFGSSRNGWPSDLEAGKKKSLAWGIDGVTPVASPLAGEMVSARGSSRRRGGEATPCNTNTLGLQIKSHAAPGQGSSNVLFTQADHVSLASEGRKMKTDIGEFVSIGKEIVLGFATPASGQIVAIEKNKITLRRTQALLFYSQGVMHVNHGEWVEKNAPILTLTYQKLITGDIVQGIPKIEQFFEAPATKEGEPLSNSLQARLRKSFQRLKQLYPVPQAVKKSLEEIQQILVEGILKVYLSQGVRIADKHLEIVIRQMTSKGQVLDVGNTGLFQGEHVRLDRIERINLATYGQKADYEPAVLGITQASLDSESFISAASFQETTRVLSRDTIIGKTDFLRGLKERVVLGDLIQAGTGVDDNINYGLLFGIVPAYKPIVDTRTRAR